MEIINDSFSENAVPRYEASQDAQYWVADINSITEIINSPYCENKFGMKIYDKYSTFLVPLYKKTEWDKTAFDPVQELKKVKCKECVISKRIMKNSEDEIGYFGVVWK